MNATTTSTTINANYVITNIKDSVILKDTLSPILTTPNHSYVNTPIVLWTSPTNPILIDMYTLNIITISTLVNTATNNLGKRNISISILSPVYIHITTHNPKTHFSKPTNKRWRNTMRIRSMCLYVFIKTVGESIQRYY